MTILNIHSPPTSTWPHLNSDVGLEVGLLDRALISLGLALESSKHFCIFGLYGAMSVFFKNYTYFTLPCRGLGLVGLALYLLD